MRPEENTGSLRELAHELRDALSPLTSCADLARLRGFDVESGRLLTEQVEQGLRRVRATLDAFALAEQCEAGTLRLALRPVPVADILRATRAALSQSELACCSFSLGDGQAVVRADVARSAQALQAVVQQAVLAAAGHAPIDVRPIVSGAETQIRVRGYCNARSLPAEEWFASHRGSDGRMTLRTARGIMALQGGALDLVRSGHGEYSLVMRFRAENAAATTERSDEVQPPSRTSRPDSPQHEAGANRILIVDDNPEVRRTYGEALGALRYAVTQAADAEQALRAFESDVAPDVALIDVHLPRMNGFALARSIRARVGASPYLVMLSGITLDPTTRNLARQAGFDDCLDKMAGPLALRELLVSGRTRR